MTATTTGYAPEFTQLRLSSGSVRVAYAGTGAPLLLINGIGASIEMWRPLASLLARTRRVIMFDAPGAGASPATRPMLMPKLARLVVELLDAGTIGPGATNAGDTDAGNTEAGNTDAGGSGAVDVLGYSWGGALAQQLASDAPARVRRLVLASTTPGVGGQLPSPIVTSLMMSPLRYLSKGFLAGAAPWIYGGDRRRPTDPDARHLSGWLDNPPTSRGYAFQTAAIACWSGLSWREQITAPTLIVQGGDDPLVPMRNGRVLARRLPNSSLHVVGGAGHLWLLDHAHEAADLITAFLD